MLKSRILQIIDLAVPRQLVGEANRAPGLTTNKNRRHPLTTCSQAHAECSLNFLRQTIHSVRKKPSSLFGHQRPDTQFQHDAFQSPRSQRILALLFAWKRIFDSDLSHRSDRSQWSERHRSVP
jgi:hypothetical protein